MKIVPLTTVLKCRVRPVKLADIAVEWLMKLVALSATVAVEWLMKLVALSAVLNCGVHSGETTDIAVDRHWIFLLLRLLF